MEHVVVFGGDVDRSRSRDSRTQPDYEAKDEVFHLATVDDHQLWTPGPRMNYARSEHAGVLCNGSVYAIGGEDTHTIERIQVADLLNTTINKTWTTLACKVSKGRGLTATTVKNRYIVVSIGYGEIDIVDTEAEAVTKCPKKMNNGWTTCGLASIGSRIYAVGP